MRRTAAGSGDRRLIIPSENRTREFDAKLLLGCIAAEAGFQVIVGNRQAIHYWIDRLPSSIYLAKDLRASSARMFEILERLGHAIVAWDEEALVYYSDAHYRAARLHGPTLRRTRALVAWGEDNARLWRSSPHYHGAPISVAGNPRLDLLRSELQPYFANEVARLKLAYGDIILVNSNFASVNPATPEAAALTRARLACSRALAFHERALTYRSRLLEHFLAMVPRLAHAFPQATIVVRPHPSEGRDTWRRHAGGCGNVFVCHEGNVVPWLLAARALVHNGCTTAIEASLLGKRPIAYQPVASEEFDIHRPNQISTRAATLEELCEAIRDRWAESAAPGVQAGIADYVAPAGNRLYSERIVGALEEMRDAGVLETGVGRCSAFVGRLKALTRRRDKADQRDDIEGGVRSEAHRFQPIAAAEVEGAIQRLSRTLKRFQGVRVTPLKPDIFSLAVG